MFTTLNPDDGTYNYRMRLDLPEQSCDEIEYILNTLSPEVAVALTVAGDAVHVGLPSAPSTVFTLAAVRRASQRSIRQVPRAPTP
jgi:hypothetical protein